VTGESEIAIVGIGCRFPDAWTPQEFWRNIDNGVVSMRELTDDQVRTAGISRELLHSPGYVRVATTLPGVQDFAGEFFGYSPKEAETMDPQQRIFLEACWEALESAGHPSRKDGPVIGVFAGSAAGTYSAAVFAAKVCRAGLTAAIDDLDLTLGSQADFLTSRAAYKLGLRGPAVSVQTACSSSLYALHYAVLSLLSGECDIALAGGATVLEPRGGYRHQPGGVLSEDGYCRSFDARSSGTTYSSGVGVVALRRLADALADGDHVLSVLRGSAVGNDGGERLGFTAPSPSGVAGVVAAALRVADVPADQLRYVEAHGTGTAVGDHIELLALTQALRASTERSGFCGLGSVMANIGHTGPAAGMAGLIKAVHIARTGLLPPHPMFERARDPGVLAESPFFVPTTAQVCMDADRHVLVNSIGVGGTNAAIVLAPPPSPVREPAREPDLIRLVVSARTRTELDALCGRLADELDKEDLPPADVAYTLRVGRSGFEERRVVVAQRHELSSVLRLPRPPAARTLRSMRRHAVVVVPPATDVPRALLESLLLVLPGSTELVTGPMASVPTGTFAILLGHGEPGSDRHVLALETGESPEELTERLDDALTAAWLNGVEVDWESHADGRGRRVPLPTYPFHRRRYWALDHLPAPAAPVGSSEPGAPETRVDATPATSASTDSLETSLIALWRDLFGIDRVGLDDEFGALGGTSLLSVRMVLEIQQRHGVLVNLHRAGGSRATVRKIAQIVRGMLGVADPALPDIDPVADGDSDLVDSDLQLSLGPLSQVKAQGRDVLLTGATGFLGAFLLHELVNVRRGSIYCIVRAADEAEARERLRDAAMRLALPEPDPERVHPIPGDLRNIAEVCERYRGGELAQRVGHVVHCAAKVVFTEPYRSLRDDNVLPTTGLLAWMRSRGILDFSYISTIAATGPAIGSDGRLLETRQQPLDPQLGGYGVSKWVSERLLERADQDGMRVRIFRPGLILASTATGACNNKDLIWRILASGLAVGAHPLDNRAIPMAPVDVVARGIVQLAISPGSVGRAYHLADETSLSPRRLFEMLDEAGLPTQPLPLKEWQQRVAREALTTGSAILSTMALYEVEGHELGEEGVQASGWQPWLRRRGLTAAPTGDLLRRGLTFLAQQDPEMGDLLIGLTDGRGRRDNLVEVR
jgi:thioester reductase-like protein